MFLYHHRIPQKYHVGSMYYVINNSRIVWLRRSNQRITWVLWKKGRPTESLLTQVFEKTKQEGRYHRIPYALYWNSFFLSKNSCSYGCKLFFHIDTEFIFNTLNNILNHDRNFCGLNWTLVNFKAICSATYICYNTIANSFQQILQTFYSEKELEAGTADTLQSCKSPYHLLQGLL